jgi:hypothetical protein
LYKYVVFLTREHLVVAKDIGQVHHVARAVFGFVGVFVFFLGGGVSVVGDSFGVEPKKFGMYTHI